MRKGFLHHRVPLCTTLLFVLFFLGSAQAWASCNCTCRYPGNPQPVGGTNEVPNPGACMQKCAFVAEVYNSPVSLESQCIEGPNGPILPIKVHFCSPIELRPAVYDTGNDSGLHGKKAGRSCIRVSNSVKVYRTWCHVWTENEITQNGYCVGSENTSTPCGPVSFIQRQFGRVILDPDNQYLVCAHVENLDPGSTRHFIMTGAAEQ